MALSTLLIWLSWALIGLAYPLFQVFLPMYLESRGAQFHQVSPNITWRNYAIANVCSIFGPVVAGFMATTVLGRKYTMVIGALPTSKSENNTLHCKLFILIYYYSVLFLGIQSSQEQRLKRCIHLCGELYLV